MSHDDQTSAKQSPDTQQPFIDYDHHRRYFEERRREYAQHPEKAKIIQRVKIEVLHDFLKEARTGGFTFRSDERAPNGGGEAPAPLQYFVAGVGF